MGIRREGREAAVQYLYHLDLNERDNTASDQDLWNLRNDEEEPEPLSEKAQVFAEQIVAGVKAHLDEIDALIQKYAANYVLSRIAAVDRNVLRVAIYEMFHSPSVPPVVAINEAIEIVKKFGSEESGRFVNGILDRVRGDVKRAPRDSAAPSTPPAQR